ncbi:hypothetical protein [Actinomadura roseirufa]|nr:hypothetical protein [Actinomadura roseirufa]
MSGPEGRAETPQVARTPERPRRDAGLVVARRGGGAECGRVGVLN